MSYKNKSLALGLCLAFAICPVGHALDPVQSGFGSMKIDGLLQFWYISDQQAGKKDDFRPRRTEIKLSGQVHPAVSWLLMIDPAKPLNVITPAQGSTRVDPKTHLFKDLALIFSGDEYVPGAFLQVGQFKPSFGMEGIQSSAELDFAERAAQSSVLGWSDYRDLGIMGGWKRGIWQARLGVFNGEGPNAPDENEDKDVSAKIMLDPVPNLHLGISGYKGKGKQDRFLNERWGVEAAWSPGPWSFKGEFAAGHGATSLGSAPGRSTGYLQGACFFHPKLQGAARFDWWEPNTNAGRDIQNEITLGVNWFVSKNNAKLQANYVIHNEEGPSVNNDLVRLVAQVSF